MGSRIKTLWGKSLHSTKSWCHSAVQQNMHPPAICTDYGKTVQFLCYSKYDVTWYFEDEQPLPINAKTFNLYSEEKFYLIIKEVQAFNVGLYSCFGRMDQHVYFLSQGSLELKKSTLCFAN